MQHLLTAACPDSVSALAEKCIVERWIAGAVFARYAVKILVPAHQDEHSYRKPEPTLEDNRALVVWHFSIDGKGTVDTMGPVVA